MQDQNVIEVKNITKSFKIYNDKGRTLKERLIMPGRNKKEIREVLKGIDFSVKKGEAIGLIGKNGCGKSTTLKLLTRIIYPDSGSIKINGRVSSLLELGAGFHPDMSGKENIYLNASIFGLSKKEIDGKVDDIISFSELEDFIEDPVRTYSSGMYMRLAFAVAINVKADILLIDEILAVGDISFQKKCFEKLKEIKREGTVIVIVSHSLDQIERICDRSIWIENGKIKEVGRPHKVHEHYLNDMEEKRLEQFQSNYYEKISDNKVDEQDNGEENRIEVDLDKKSETDNHFINQMLQFKKNLLNVKEKEETGNGKVYFSDLYITDENENENLSFKTGDCINVYMKYKVVPKHAKGSICLLIYRDDGVYCFGTNSFFENRTILDLEQFSVLKIQIKNISLLPGKYYFSIGINDEDAVTYDYIENAACIQIFSNKGDLGVARIDSEWILQ